MQPNMKMLENDWTQFHLVDMCRFRKAPRPALRYRSIAHGFPAHSLRATCYFCPEAVSKWEAIIRRRGQWRFFSRPPQREVLKCA